MYTAHSIKLSKGERKDQNNYYYNNMITHNKIINVP